MIVYEGIKSDFLENVEDDTIADKIEQLILQKMGRHTVANERMSWVNSMEYMYKVMNDPEIPSDAGIAIEYNIPQTAKRVDFMISGYDINKRPGMVIIELKQWSKLNKVYNSNALVETYTGNAERKVVHPSYQAWSYARLIADYNSAVQDQNVHLIPCAYLHNYIRKDDDPVDDRQYAAYTSEAPVFTKGQVPDLRAFIKKCVKTGDKEKVLYLVDRGTIRPSKSLQDSIASMIKGNKEFVMIDEQRVVYEEIIKLSTKCQRDHKKRTIICKGGPGTGKSVIAVRLLAELTQRGQFVQYVTHNSAPRQVYAAKLKGKVKKSSVDNMFKNSGTYTEVGNNKIHTLLVDEAHRLSEKSGMFHNKGENQIKEIIHAAACSVFFIDESQRVTMSDIGSVDEILKWAKEEGSEVTELELLSQFRCNGSNGYLAWVDDLLEIRETANYNLYGLGYDVRVFDNPEDMRKLILEKNKVNNRSRILAGYCWDWPKKTRNDTDFHDIKIGDFEISWNLDGGEAFAIGEYSVNEAGCIHTTQGLEFDYVGVIMGDDIRYENGHVVTDFKKRAKTDQSLRGIKKLYKEHPEDAVDRADEIIKNTYRTLMTRGMKGCYIYCTDPGMRKYIRKRLEMVSE
ncbi:DNA/RNA helicase domain-containing protein [Bilifractor sp. LCP21S3_A7]|uniref:DNA/RNA helicase domain-containing protein n=1 Tax=Bilifractor sp. LCP21S3_A7 TaxID=3438738 RepID=UPI003F91A7C9